MERVLAIAGEIQAELDGLQTCPAPCEDGTVQVTPKSGKPQCVRCPILSEFCPYGSTLREMLETFLRKLALDAGIPERHAENFGAYIETLTFTRTRQWRFVGFLVLSGGSGVGKSFGAAWALKEFLRSRIPDPLDTETWNRAAYAAERAMWATANEIIRDKNKLEEARNKLFLVIDDLGREGNLSTRQADVSDIVSARYDEKLPTVVTTEMSFNDILKAYGRNTAFKLVEDNGENGGIFALCGDFSLRHETGEVWEFLDETDDNR
jgi:hypothetical protein